MLRYERSKLMTTDFDHGRYMLLANNAKWKIRQFFLAYVILILTSLEL